MSQFTREFIFICLFIWQLPASFIAKLLSFPPAHRSILLLLTLRRSHGTVEIFTQMCGLLCKSSVDCMSHLSRAPAKTLWEGRCFPKISCGENLTALVLGKFWPHRELYAERTCRGLKVPPIVFFFTNRLQCCPQRHSSMWSWRLVLGEKYHSLNLPWEICWEDWMEAPWGLLLRSEILGGGGSPVCGFFVLLCTEARTPSHFSSA